jgi:hypothetical protein
MDNALMTPDHDLPLQELMDALKLKQAVMMGTSGGLSIYLCICLYLPVCIYVSMHLPV